MKESKFFTTLAVLYTVIGVSSLPLGYKLVKLGPILVSGGAFFVPFRFMLGDILAEVYGYKLARRQILNLVLSSFVFSIFAYIIIRLPSPTYWDHQEAFQFVLGKTLYITSVATIGVLIGSNINMYIVSKLRLKLKSKLFFLRSVSASITGELTQYVIVLMFLYIGTLPFNKIFELIVYDYSLQLVFIFIVATPASFIVYLLKRHEHIDLTQEAVNFNPFKRESTSLQTKTQEAP